MQPISSRTLPTAGYEIVAGERRWRAARMAGLTTVPALVKEIPDQQALAAALIENIQREDLNPLEEATGHTAPCRRNSDSRIRRSRTRWADLVRLSPICCACSSLRRRCGNCSREGRSIWAMHVHCLRYPSRARSNLRAKPHKKSLRAGSGAACGERAEGCPGRVAHASTGISRGWKRNGRERLGTTVQIKPRGKRGGKLVLTYRSLDELDRLLEKRLGSNKQPAEHLCRRSF